MRTYLGVSDAALKLLLTGSLWLEDHRRAELDVKGVGRRYMEGNLHPLAMKLVSS